MKNFKWIQVDARTPRGVNKMPEISRAVVLYAAIALLMGVVFYFATSPW